MAAPVQHTIYYLGVFRNDQPPPAELVGKKDMSSFSRFTVKSATEFMDLGVKTIAERTKPGMRQQIEHGANTKIHAYATSRGVCGIMVTDGDYDKKSAQQCLSKLVDEFVSNNPDIRATSFRSPPLDKYIMDWRDENKIDNITAVQRELDETKVVLHKTIESVLERGEKIDDLVAKSDNLSFQSKMFYQSAKKQNSCCTVM